ncbi:MAG TPA: hypothetical protein VG347_17990 [Verrucomicrobiae bacterium]|nr:hypothetical protein [Verrucomicrobiae bacterium]
MAMLFVLAFLGAGCGGFSGSKSFSPLDFLLMKANPPATNSLPVIHFENSTGLASGR